MKTILTSVLLLSLSWALHAQTPVPVEGTETVTQTNIVTKRFVNIPGVQVDRSIDRGGRPSAQIVTTQAVDRHTLTFKWNGKDFTVTYDVPKGDPVVEVQLLTWQASDAAKAAYDAAVAAKGGGTQTKP